MVFSDLEPHADAILVSFGVQDQALLEVVSGDAEPSGLLPLQMPADMRTVEEQAEDVPRDMECHVGSEGNTYDFGFGLSFEGVIEDERTARYRGGTDGGADPTTRQTTARRLRWEPSGTALAVLAPRRHDG